MTVINFDLCPYKFHSFFFLYTKFVLNCPFDLENISNFIVNGCLLSGIIQQEEDEVPDDETVNQMIARSEEEFEQFMVCVVHFLTYR